MNIKSEKGITLLTLTIYMIIMLIVVAIMSTVSTFFYNNVGIVKNSAKYAAEFDNFNAYFTIDVKNNSNCSINGNTIVFENGATYVYNSSDNGIYRGNQKIATNVKEFYVNKSTLTLDGFDKTIITIRITIGKSEKTWFSNTINYTLKYW